MPLAKNKRNEPVVGEDTEDEALEDMTAKDLKVLAKERGVKVSRGTDLAGLVKLLK